MLQHLRPRDGPLLVHMAHHEAGVAVELGRLHQSHGAVLHLADAAGTAGEVPVEHGLDGVNDDHLGLFQLDGPEDVVQVCLRQHQDPVLGHPQPPRPHFQLPGALLPCDIEDFFVSQQAADLQQQRGLADARRPPHQDDGARYRAAPQHPVQLPHAGGKAQLLVVPLQLGDGLREVHHSRPRRFDRPRLAPVWSGVLGSLHQGVPMLAGGALAEPFTCLVPAFRTEKSGLFFHSFCFAPMYSRISKDFCSPPSTY